MTLQLYNTLSRKLEPFKPLDPAKVTMYVCGPTVYNYVHIGNGRGPVVFDVLANALRRRFGNVIYARNITDVDDKINTAALERNVPITEITDKYTAAYLQDMAALGVQAPTIAPTATGHIDEIIEMIATLIERGHAYESQGHVLFAVSSYADYGKLSGRNPEELLAGARVEIAPYKREAGDFVLWKPSDASLPGWVSPWGRGRPGWHIECSAMAATHLGETIDIHAGGMDLQFPHHENEIAQSVCAHGGKPFARFWLHNGMLNFDGSKMSKSIGNIECIHDLVAKHPAEALRYALLSAQYRQPLEWSDGLISQSIKTLDRLYGTLRDVADIDSVAAIPDSVELALDDDLNTPNVLAQIAGFAAEIRRELTAAQPNLERLRELKSQLLGAGLTLGILQQEPATWFARASDEQDDARIEALVQERVQAKADRDFSRADTIRDQLSAEGIVIEDTPAGVRWRRQ